MSQEPISLDEQRLSDMINDLDKEFSKVPVVDMPTIAEDFFVRTFLPMFAGDEVLQYPVTPAMWLNISHSAFNEVRVIDGSGQEIYRVPPILDSSVLKPLDGTGKAGALPSITDMLMRARLVGRQGINAMNRYMTEELERRQFIFSDQSDTTLTARWNDIFKRYGRLENAAGESLNVSANATDKPIDHDSSEFEPL